MDYVVNTCPECGGNYEFLTEEVGRQWSCPHCGTAITLAPGPSLGGVCVAMFMGYGIRVTAPLDPEQLEWLIQLGTSRLGQEQHSLRLALTRPRHTASLRLSCSRSSTPCVILLAFSLSSAEARNPYPSGGLWSVLWQHLRARFACALCITGEEMTRREEGRSGA